MSSKDDARKGNQEPRVRIEPNFFDTDGRDACEFSANYGMVPDPWQQSVLESWLARDRSDNLSSSRCALIVPRQNGKNGCLEIREFYGAVILGERLLHTAHEVRTNRKAFQRVVGFFENPNHPEINDLVTDIRRGKGEEAVFLSNGGSIEFSARSRGAARGLTVDVVIADEAQELTDEQLEALMSTSSSAPSGSPQLILTFTPPSYNSPGDVVRRLRAEAVSSEETDISWFEWSVEGLVDPNNREHWYETNPAIGHRVLIKAIEAEAKTLSSEGFNRERLCWWPKRDIQKVVVPEDWAALATKEPPMEGKTAYGVKFAPGGRSVSLAVALKPRDGKAYVELIEHRSMAAGISWLAGWLAERWRQAAVIVIDGRDSAQPLAEALYSAGVPKNVVYLPRSNDIVAAASMTLNGIRESSFQHFDQPLLNEVALNAQKRPIGKDGGWGWGGVDIDVSPLEAVSLALWGATNSKRDPTRKQVISF